MKSIVILFSFVIFACAVKQDTFKLPEERKANLQKAGTTCATVHKVDPGLLSKIFDASLPRDDATNKYLYCMGEKLGLVDVNGHVILDKAAGYVGNHPLVEDYKKALAKCNEVTKENPVETIVEVHRCYVENSPILFEF